MSDSKNETTALAPTKRVSLVQTMALSYGLEEGPFMEAIRQTVMPGNATTAQTAAFLQVAHSYKLNPFIKEIYAFPAKSGGIMPMISIDGWLSIANRDPRYEGYEYEEILDEKGNLEGGKVTIYRSDRQRPHVHREWFRECKRNTDPWNNMPRRMMENRTVAQGIRRALGISGLMDIDEVEQMHEINITGQSSVLERSTETKTAALKEKIGAKRGRPTTEKVTEPEKPALAMPEPVPDPEPEAEAEIIAPAAEPEPAPQAAQNARQKFLNAASDKATELGLSQDDAKTRIREVLFSAGYTKFQDVPKAEVQGLIDTIKGWK
jgi:phage recombination protein Bet